MSDRILVDTDVLIDYMHGHPEAVAFVTGQRLRGSVSVVTVTELLSGARDSEMQKLRDLLERFTQLEVTRDIAERAGFFRREFRKSVKIETPDALIAATALEHGLPLATLNRKHFPRINVVTPYVKH